MIYDQYSPPGSPRNQALILAVPCLNRGVRQPDGRRMGAGLQGSAPLCRARYRGGDARPRLRQGGPFLKKGAQQRVDGSVPVADIGAPAGPARAPWPQPAPNDGGTPMRFPPGKPMSPLSLRPGRSSPGWAALVLMGLFFSPVLEAARGAERHGERPPNIVFILADDKCYNWRGSSRKARDFWCFLADMAAEWVVGNWLELRAIAVH